MATSHSGQFMIKKVTEILAAILQGIIYVVAGVPLILFCLLIASVLYPVVRVQHKNLCIKSYFWGIAVSVDQLGNAYRGGDPDETISSAADKSDRGWSKILSWVLEKLDPGHMERHREDDEGENTAYKRKVAKTRRS